MLKDFFVKVFRKYFINVLSKICENFRLTTSKVLVKLQSNCREGSKNIKKKKKKIKNHTSMGKWKCIGHKGKLLFWFVNFCSKSELSLCSLCFYLSIEV